MKSTNTLELGYPRERHQYTGTGFTPVKRTNTLKLGQLEWKAPTHWNRVNYSEKHQHTGTGFHRVQGTNTVELGSPDCKAPTHWNWVHPSARHQHTGTGLTRVKSTNTLELGSPDCKAPTHWNWVHPSARHQHTGTGFTRVQGTNTLEPAEGSNLRRTATLGRLESIRWPSNCRGSVNFCVMIVGSRNLSQRPSKYSSMACWYFLGL